MEPVLLLLAVATGITLIATTENNRGGWGTFLLLVALAITGLVVGFKVLLTLALSLVSSPWLFALNAFLYVAVGIGWSIAKWWLYIKEKRVKRGDMWASSDFNPAYNKDRIMTWLMYWPFSLVWTILDQPIVRFYKWVYRKVSGVYEYIGRKAYGGTE